MIRGLLGTIAALVVLLALAGQKIMEQDRAIAAKPKIEYREKIVERKVQVRVAGPVRVEEKITEGPGRERVIERVVYKEAVKTDTETGRESSVDRKEEAACPPAPRAKSRHLVAEFGASGGGVPFGLRGGMSFLDALPISPLVEAGYRKYGQDRIYAAAGIRF
jgi:hypothetical protein